MKIRKSIVNQLYRPGATIGDGGTADALRNENKTGESTSGRVHRQKVEERARQIRKILRKNPNHPDKAVLEYLLNDLEDALKGGNKK